MTLWFLVIGAGLGLLGGLVAGWRGRALWRRPPWSRCWPCRLLLRQSRPGPASTCSDPTSTRLETQRRRRLDHDGARRRVLRRLPRLADRRAGRVCWEQWRLSRTVARNAPHRRGRRRNLSFRPFLSTAFHQGVPCPVRRCHHRVQAATVRRRRKARAATAAPAGPGGYGPPRGPGVPPPAGFGGYGGPPQGPRRVDHPRPAAARAEEEPDTHDHRAVGRHWR